MKKFLKDVFGAAVIIVLAMMLLMIGCSKKRTITLTPADLGGSTPTMTRTTGPVATATFTAGTPGLPAGQVSQFESALAPSQSKLVLPTPGFTPGYWFTFDDWGAPNNGGSMVWPDSSKYAANHPTMTPGPFVVVTPGNSGTNGTHCVRITGYATGYGYGNPRCPAIPTETPVYQYGFVGVGINFQDPAANTDFSQFGHLKFWYKMGDTKNYRVKLSCPDVFAEGDGANMYGVVLPGTLTWTQFDQPLLDVAGGGQWAQEAGWGTAPTCPTGTAWECVMKNCRGIQWQTTFYSCALPPDSTNTVDFYLDDVVLY